MLHLWQLTKYGKKKNSKIQQLQVHLQKCKKQLDASSSWALVYFKCKWTIPFLIPHLMFLLLLITSCFINCSSINKFKNSLIKHLISYCYRTTSFSSQNLKLLTPEYALTVKMLTAPDNRKQSEEHGAPTSHT